MIPNIYFISFVLMFMHWTMITGQKDNWWMFAMILLPCVNTAMTIFLAIAVIYKGHWPHAVKKVGSFELNWKN